MFSHLMEGIGLALDLKGGRMFITDLAGSVYSADLDGSNKKALLVARATSPASPTPKSEHHQRRKNMSKPNLFAASPS